MRRPGDLGPLDVRLPPEVHGLTRSLRDARAASGLSSAEIYRRAKVIAPHDVTSTSQLSRIFTPGFGSRALEPLARYRAVAEVLQLPVDDLEVDFALAQAAFGRARAATEAEAGTPGRGSEDAEPESAGAAAEPGPTAPDPKPESPMNDSAGRIGSRRALRSSLLFVAVIVILGVVGAVAWSTGEFGGVDRARLDGSDPIASGCSQPTTDQVYFSTLFEDWPVRQVRTAGRIELHYSSECRTAWAVLQGAPPGALATLTRLSDNKTLSCIAGPDGRCSTLQLGNADVLVHATGRTVTAFGQTRDV